MTRLDHFGHPGHQALFIYGLGYAIP